jgi:hypothetical protein
MWVVHGKMYLITIVTISLFRALIITLSISRQYTEVYMAGAMCKSSFGHHRTCPHEDVHALVPQEGGLDQVCAR